MIKKEDIKRVTVELLKEQSEMETKFIDSAVHNTESHIEKYKKMQASFNGQYINADLFKETFPDYSENMDTRLYYSTVVHNSAAVLSNELFNRMINDKKIKKCIFITGVPGSGKSFLVQNLLFENEIDADTVIYEGNIGAIDTIKVKIDSALNNNLEVSIWVIDISLELALNNTFKRFYESGRGAGTKTMANIYSSIPTTLNQLYSIYSDKINLGIYSKHSNHNVTIFEGWDNLAVLNRLDYDTAKRYLDDLAEEKYREGTIDERCYYQACRKTIREINVEEVNGKSKS